MIPTPKLLLALRERVGTSCWFVPSLTAAATVALTLVMVQVDRLAARIARASSRHTAAPSPAEPADPSRRTPEAAGEGLMGVAR